MSSVKAFEDIHSLKRSTPSVFLTSPARIHPSPKLGQGHLELQEDTLLHIVEEATTVTSVLWSNFSGLRDLLYLQVLGLPAQTADPMLA